MEKSAQKKRRKSSGKRFSPCPFLQVRAGSGKCVSSTALSATGLTVKEKLGGERECGVKSEREERMGGP